MTAATDDRWLRAALPMAACVCLVSTIAQIRVPLMPAIGDELAMSATELGVAVTLFGLARIAMDIPAGRLVDRFPAMRLLVGAALVMTIGSLVLAGAVGSTAVMVSFFLLGAASAAANTTGMTSLSGAAPAHRRGAAMALFSGSLLAGQALGPAVSGLAAGLGTWRTAAVVGAVIGVGLMVFALAWRPRTAAGSGPRTRTAPSHRALTRRELSVVYAAGFGVFLCIGALPQTLLPLIGAYDLGLGVTAIGLALGLGGLVRVVSAGTVGMIADRVSRRAALLPCMALQALGVVLLAVDAGLSLWLVGLMLMSAGASAYSVAGTIIADTTPSQLLGHHLGRFRFFSDVGIVVGPLMSGALYELWGRSAAVGVVAAILVVSAVAAAVVIPETGRATPVGLERP